MTLRVHVTGKFTRDNGRDTPDRESGVEARAPLSRSAFAVRPSFELPVRPGEVLAGKYQLDEVVGVGSVAFVMSAVDIELNARVAIKFLRPEFLIHDEAVRRFADEARSAVAITSDFVACVFEVGYLPDGTPFIVMELLEGKDLRQVLLEQGRLPCEHAVTYALQVCEALAAGHALGVIHRDIKPGNLFLSKQEQGPDIIKVLDFGISKAGLDADALGRPPRQNHTLIAFGSPVYMPPEQMRAKLEMDARADIWSFGCVLYELLSGTMPFDAPSPMQVCAVVLENQPEALSSLVPGISPELEAIVMRCLQKDPDLRFQNVAELALALLPFAPVPQPMAASTDASPHAAELSAADGAVPPAAAAARGYSKWWPLLAAVLIALAVVVRVLGPPAPATRSATPVRSALPGQVIPGPTLPGQPVPGPSITESTASSSAQTIGGGTQPVEPVVAPPPTPAAAPSVQPALDEKRSATVNARSRSSHSGKPVRAKSASRARPLTKSAPATHDEEATPALEVEDDELATRASAEAPTGPELGPSDQLERGTEATAIATVDAHRAPVATPAPTAPVRPAIAARPTPTLATPAPGTIALRAVGAVIRSHANEVQDCAERAQMDHPNLHGRMLFRATVDRFGNVTNAWSDSRLDNGARLTACILARAREWKFPAPAGGTNGSVSYTFVFD